MAILTEYLGSVNDTFNQGTGSKVAIAFEVPAGSVIEGWGIIGSQGVTGTAGTFSVKIIENAGGNPDVGTIVAEETYNRTVLGAYTASPTLKSFTFGTPTGTLTGGSTVYYLLIESLTGSSNDNLRWSADSTAVVYDYRSRYTVNGGSTWPTIATYVQNFQITGTEGGGGTAYRRLQPFAGL
jgi:hypothetical protein